MEKNRGETPTFLGMRWDRYRKLLAHRDILERRNIRAFRRIDHRGAHGYLQRRSYSPQTVPGKCAGTMLDDVVSVRVSVTEGRSAGPLAQFGISR